jgi:hypothetical protein
MFLSDILIPYIVKNFSDYNCYHLNIHLDSRLNIQELYCYEFYEIRSVFDASVNIQLFLFENLNQVDNHKHLGVTISSNCKWAEHINNIFQKND